MPTTKEIWEKGDEIGNWVCDVNPETGEMQSNGGIEHIMVLNDLAYSVITDFEGKIVYMPEMECMPLFNNSASTL